MVIGVTGNYGVGKTTVARIFGCLGARVIDADKIAHQILKPNSSTYKQIIASFGKGVLRGIYINRKRLAEIAFSAPRHLIYPLSIPVLSF